jgi:thioredoxin-related protein
MNLKLFSICFLVLAALPLVGQNKIRWTSWEYANEKVKKGDKKFFVYVYYDGCKWCRFMEDKTFAHDHIAKFINSNFYAFHINASASDKIIVADKAYTTVRIGKYDFHELAVDLVSGNMSFPSFVFLDEQFKKIAAYDRFVDVDVFEVMLSYYVGDHHKKVMWRKYANNYCRESHFNALVNGRP